MTISHDTEQQLQALEAVMGALPSGKQGLAASVIANTRAQGATVNRMALIADLITQAKASGGGMPAAPATSVGSFAKVKALIDLARENLRKPKIRLLLRSGSPLVLALASPHGKAPGTIDVTDGGGFGNSCWFGRVTLDGAFTKSPKVGDLESAEIEALLKKLGEAPAQVAAEYGHLTGRCCFCNLQLSDERSTAAGFGKTCAANYGLLDAWKESDALLKTRDAQALATA